MFHGRDARVPLVLDAFDGKFGVDGFAEVVFDVVFDGDGGVGAMAAGAAETEVDFFAVDADEFEVAAVGLEGGAEFVEFGCDLVEHGRGIPWRVLGERGKVAGASSSQMATEGAGCSRYFVIFSKS